MFINNMNSPGKSNKLLHFLLFSLIPFIIYFYFLKWKTISIHDDDLYIYLAYLKKQSTINISLSFGQYRPVRDFFLHLIVPLFQKDYTTYYYFNVVVQSINTIVFACLLNLVLRSMSVSLFLSLILGLSRFCFYNVTQLFNGGLLEGLAMMFFLFFLYFTVQITTRHDINTFMQKKGILLSILFANLTLYTHERYILIFPFILLMVLFFPKFKGISLRWKIAVSLITIASIFLNIIIKTRLYSLTFLKGTGNTNIEFSFSSAFKFLEDAILGIFQYSKGPEYLIGLQFSSLPMLCQVFVFLIIIGFLYIVGFYLWKGFSTLFLKKGNYLPNTALFFFLFILFLLCLVPAIFQTRLELRWFQASLSVLILMFVIGINNLEFKNIGRKYLLCFILAICFVFTNYYYVYNGSQNLYYSTSAKIGNAFDKAINDSIIHLGKTKIYILEKQRNAARENELKWALGNGDFFSLYQSNIKTIIFSEPKSSFSNFNKNNDEIIFLDIQNDGQTFKYSIADITNEYLTYSLQKSNEGKTDSVHKIFHANKLKITNESINDFITDGFYDNENGIRWTNGNATIKFVTDYIIQDSVIVKLNTYMPPLCENVKPKIYLAGYGKEYQASFLKREGDIFIFKCYLKEVTAIQKINLRGEVINSGSSDQRVLSFPFKSLEINQNP